VEGDAGAGAAPDSANIAVGPDTVAAHLAIADANDKPTSAAANIDSSTAYTTESTPASSQDSYISEKSGNSFPESVFPNVLTPSVVRIADTPDDLPEYQPSFPQWVPSSLLSSRPPEPQNDFATMQKVNFVMTRTYDEIREARGARLRKNDPILVDPRRQSRKPREEAVRPTTAPVRRSRRPEKQAARVATPPANADEHSTPHADIQLSDPPASKLMSAVVLFQQRNVAKISSKLDQMMHRIEKESERVR
jgi:hypothetical protein